MNRIILTFLFFILSIPAWATTLFMEPGTDATQDFSLWSSTTVSNSGAITSDNTISHTGPRSIKLATGGTANSNVTAVKSGILADTGRRVNVWFRTDTPMVPSGNPRILEGTSGANIIWVVLLTSTGQLKMSPTGATAVTGTTVLSANTWYRICVSYYITNATTFTFKVYVNGVLDSTTNAGTLTNTGAVDFTIRSQINISNAHEWFDDIYVDNGASSSSQPDTGDIRITSKRPFSNGTTNGFTTQIGAGGSGYGTGHAPQVNEQPLSITNGWSILETGSAITEEYNIEGIATGDVDLTGQTIVDTGGWIYTKSVAGENAQLILNGNNNAITIPANANTAFLAYSGSTSYPSGSGSDIGEVSSAGATTISLYEAGVLIAFNPIHTNLIEGNSLIQGTSLLN